MSKYRRTLARSNQSYPLTGHQVPNHLCENEGEENRSIPISKELYEEIMALDGFNFFTDCYFQFLSVMEKTSIVLLAVN